MESVYVHELGSHLSDGGAVGVVRGIGGRTVLPLGEALEAISQAREGLSNVRLEIRSIDDSGGQFLVLVGYRDATIEDIADAEERLKRVKSYWGPGHYEATTLARAIQYARSNLADAADEDSGE